MQKITTCFVKIAETRKLATKYWQTVTMTRRRFCVKNTKPVLHEQRNKVWRNNNQVLLIFNISIKCDKNMSSAIKTVIISSNKYKTKDRQNEASLIIQGTMSWI